MSRIGRPELLPAGYRGEAFARRDGQMRVRVFAPNGRTIGDSGTWYEAAGLADRHEKNARSRERPCICCGETFRSEGPHNRMCYRCRSSAEEAVAV